MAHVNPLSGPALTLGGVLLRVTKATSVEVHKGFAGLVTVKV